MYVYSAFPFFVKNIEPNNILSNELKSSHVVFLYKRVIDECTKLFAMSSSKQNCLLLAAAILHYTGKSEIQNSTNYANRPFALTSQILRLSSRCSLTISVRVQKPHTAQELAILIQNYYKLLKNLLCLQKLYYA